MELNKFKKIDATFKVSFALQSDEAGFNSANEPAAIKLWAYNIYSLSTLQLM